MRTSIRARLTLSLLATLGAAALLVGGVTYRNVLAEAETLFDYQLRQMALSLRDQGGFSPGDRAALGNEELDFVVQIWDIDGHRAYGSRNHRAVPTRAVLGLADVVAPGGERWRTFAVSDGLRVIQVAQPQAIRQRLAAESALRSVLPLLAAAPLMAAVLWWLIARSLQPLSRLAQQLGQRDAAALEPLPDQTLPAEVAPLVRALNALLRRLGEALDGQRAFVADAAHELRSPLTALKLQAQMVERAGDPAQRAQAVAALLAGVDRASRLVGQLLALARTEPGSAPRREPVDLAALARQVLADEAGLAQQRGATLALQAEAWPAAATVPGDAAALAVLLRNLVDNALRYSPEGGRVVLTLSPPQQTPAGAQATLAVDDSGPGIAPAERPRVFERFVRGAASAGQTGSGLGLAIVQAVAQRHGGQVALDDSPLGGLRVVVTLPAEAAPAPAPIPAPARPTTPAALAAPVPAPIPAPPAPSRPAPTAQPPD